MNKSLINQLWLHTHRIDAYNKEHNWTDFDPIMIKKQSKYNPLQIPADIFLRDSSPIFMSFHDEESNANQHYHDFFEINYVIKGNPIGVIDNRELQLSTHSLCIMNPNAIHYFKSYHDNHDLILNIVLPKETFEKHIYIPLLGNPTLNAFFMRYQIENEKGPSFLYLSQLDPSVEVLIEMLMKEYLSNESYSHVIIESLVTLLFSYILRSYSTQSLQENHQIHEILEYIYANYNSCSLIEVSNKFNYHPKYLSSLLHKHSGDTFRDLLTKIKLQNSVYYLLYTDYSIEKISGLVGYAEKSSFFSSFKKRYHMTPSQYRSSQSSLSILP